MEYRPLGTSGVRVSAIGLGAFNLGAPDIDESDAKEIVYLALDAGINLFDTANVYQEGRSEEVLGAALRGVRDSVVLSTKVFNPVGSGPNDSGLSAYHLHRECERSLRRLQVDHIDIYLLHRLDASVPAEETVSALDDLVRSGKIRYWGTSTFPTSEDLAKAEGVGVVRSWEIVRMIAEANRRAARRPVCDQLPYSLMEREVEQHILPLCAEYGVGAIAYSPLAMGLLTERFTGQGPPGHTRFTSWFDGASALWSDTFAAVRQFSAVAGQAGLTLPELAYRWLLDSPCLSSALAGPRSTGQLQQAIRAAASPSLDDDLRRQLDAICQPGRSLWLRVAEQVHRCNASRPHGGAGS